MLKTHKKGSRRESVNPFKWNLCETPYWLSASIACAAVRPETMISVTALPRQPPPPW